MDMDLDLFEFLNIVGNGTSATARKNAHTLDWNGNAEFYGNIIAYGCGSDKIPISLLEINNRTNYLETAIGDIIDITSEEIQALFN